MKPDKRLSVVKSAEPSGFYELAKAHVEGHGGAWFIADKRQNLQQWRAWIAYFAWLDDQTTPRGGKAATFRKLETLTVPTTWPLEFDPGAPPAPLAEPREEAPTLERRRELTGMLLRSFKDLGAAIASKRAAGEPPGSARPKPFTLPVDEARPLYPGKAPVVTAEFARYLEGMQAARDEIEDEAINF